MSRIDGRREYSFVGMRVIIPLSLRERVLDELHADHPFQNFLQFYSLVIKSLYSTIIPRGRVGYEMINSQRGA